MTRNRTYAWPLYAAISTGIALHAAAELAQYLALLDFPRSAAVMVTILTFAAVLTLAALLGVDLFESARELSESRDD